MTPSKAKIQDTLKALAATENIFNEISGKSPREAFKPVVQPKAIDISHINVPDQLVESVINFATGKTKSVKIEEPVVEVEEINEEVVATTKLSDLVRRLSDLLKEAKEFLGEMTTTGMIGTNQKFNLLKKKKNGPTKTTKRN
jgi:hypothetical protein